MRVVVVGATGGTGRQLVEQALARGYHVTAFVRDPRRLSRPHSEALRIAVGDVLDKPSLEQAIRGSDAVVCALGHKRWFYPNRILSAGTQNIVDVMKAAGVRRLVCETSLGVGNSFGRLGIYYTLFVVPFVLPLYYWDKYRQERVVQNSGLDWIIVRPAVLTDGPRRGKYRHGPKAGSWILTHRVARADVADFMLDQLTNDTYLHATPAIAR
jgi:uncharacterized protein YbjT (DUF2867 family)